LRRRAPLTLFLCSLAAAVGGCGDDTDDVSAEELVSRGDEICREGRERFAEIQDHAPQSADEAREQTEELVDAASEELDELEGLRPPEEVRDAYDRYLEARSDALDLLERGRDAAADGDAGAYADAQTELEEGRRERARLARALGFRDCSGA
jgi:hypothetical protein